MSTKRHHPRGTLYPFWRVIVQPTRRGPIWVGDFADEAEARRADDDARLWLCDLALLRDGLMADWHDRDRAHRVLGLRSEPLPACPPKLAGWLSRRGWKVPGYEGEPFKIHSNAADVESLRKFLAGLGMLESRVSQLEEGAPQSGDLSGQPQTPFVI